MKDDDIKKIDEQIENLKNASTIRNKEEDREIIIDKKYDYDDIGAGDTKKLDTVSDINNESVEEITKKIDTVADIEEKPIEVEKPVEEKFEFTEPERIIEEKHNKSNKLIPILIIVGLVIVVILIILLVLLKTKTSSGSSDKDDVLSKNEEKQVINGYGDALKAVIAIYYEKQNVLLEYDDAIKLIDYKYDVVCKTHEIYDDGSVYLSKCTIDDKSTSYSYGTKQEKKEEPKISEDAIKVYVSKKGKIATLKEPKNIDDYDLYTFEIDGKYSNLRLFSDNSEYVLYTDGDENGHMVNYRTTKKILDGLNYQSVLPIKVGEVYDFKYIAIEINGKWGIYNITNNERVIPNRYDSVTPALYMGVGGPDIEVNALDDGVIAVVNYTNNGYSTSSEYGLINYKTTKDLIKQEYKNMIKSGSYIWAIDFYGEGHIFDYEGKEYLDGKYDKIYWIVDGKYVLVNVEGEIKLVSIKGKDIYSYGKINIGSINYGLAYNNGALFQFNNPDATGENDGCIEVIYDSSAKTGEFKNSYCGGIAKPVLYLYPKKTTKVTVTFEHPEFLDTTYPKYVDKWEVKAHSNGDLYDNDGAYYYALYWDEKQVHSVDFSTGYYVEKDDAISFLEQKLSYIGLSRREANEFIMYWLPILEKNEKSLVYFELTEERESYNKLNISPKPDSMLRLVIHIKKVDQKVNIPKQSLTKFQRKGFVAVEWGGTVY